MSDAPIATPWRQRLQEARATLAPALVFLAAAIAATWLWTRQATPSTVVGEVVALRTDVASPADGVLAALPRPPWQVLDAVACGEPVAQVNDEPAADGLEALRAESVRLQAELATAAQRAELEQADRRDRRFDQARRLALDVQRLRLDVLDRTATLAAGRVEATRLQTQEAALRQLAEGGIESKLAYADVQLRLERLQTQVANGEHSLQGARDLQAEAEARLRAQPEELAQADLEVYLAPVRAAVSAQEARVREWEAQRRQLTVRAPLAGTVVAVHRWPGQAVRLGDPILTLAAPGGRHVIGYVRERQPLALRPGMPVDVRTRARPQWAVSGRVDAVGNQVGPIPPHLLADPRMPDWGVPVRIALNQDAGLAAGERVDLCFPTARGLPQ